MASRTFLRRLHSFSCALRQTFSNHKTSHIEAHRLTLPLASQPSQSLLFTRSVSQKQLQEEEAKQITWLDWLMEPVLKAFHAPEKVRTEEEINERQELLSRIQACYYKKPPEEPGKEFFIEAFHTLIKYDDWRAVEALWRFSEMSDHQFDDDLLDKIEDYLLDARQRRWYED